MFGRKPQPVHGLRKKVQAIYDLICQKNLKLAQTELIKLVKKQKSKSSSLEALQVLINVLINKNVISIQELENQLEVLRTGEEDEQTVNIIASAFRYVGRCDKVAEAFLIYYERFQRPIYLESCYDNYVRDVNLDEQIKHAMKLDRVIEINKKRFCTSSFLLAAFKKTMQDRSKGMKFTALMANKMFKDDSDFLKEFMETVEEFNPILLLHENERIINDVEFEKPIIRLKNPIGTEATLRINLNISVHSDLPNELYDLGEGSIDLFKKKLYLLRNSERDWNSWEDVIQFALREDIYKQDRSSVNLLMDVFKDLLSDDKGDKDVLLATMKFIELSGTTLDSKNIHYFLDIFVKNYGHLPDAIQQIVPFFLKLNAEEQELILRANSEFIRKYFHVLKEWIDSGSDKYGKKPSEIEWKDMSTNLNGIYSVKNYGFLVVFYYQRMLLDEILNNYRGEGEFSYSGIENRINFWDNAIDFMYRINISSEVSLDSLITIITRQCAQYFWWLFINLNNQKYMSGLVCFLIKQGNKTATRSQVLQLLMSKCYHELCNADCVSDLFDEMQLRPLQYQSMGYYLDDYLQNVGRFDQAYKELEFLNHKYFCYLLDMQDNLVMTCSEGRAAQALEIAIMVHQSRNLIQRSLHYSRKQFLDLILKNKNYLQISDNLLRDGWPEKNPFDHRDYQIILQNLPYQDSANAAYVQMQSYCYNICEINVNRLLLETVVIMYEGVSDKTSRRLSEIEEMLTFHIDFANNVDERSNPAMVSTINSLREPVFVLFIDLIKHCLNCLSKIEKSQSLDTNQLPSVGFFRKIYNAIESIFVTIFKQKDNHGKQFLVLSTALKMNQYISHLIIAMYKLIATLLNINVEQMKTVKKYKSFFDCFRKYGMEVKIMMELIELFSKKLHLRITSKKSLIKKLAKQENEIGISTKEYLKTSVEDFEESLRIQKKYINIDHLLKFNLVE